MIANRHIRLFDLIAPVYSLFFRLQVRQYRRVIKEKAGGCLTNGRYKILDIGCGTGALAYVLSELGQDVTGVDGSPRMIRLARWLNRKNPAVFQVGDALDLYDPAGCLERYTRHSDIVVASYVLHGLSKEQRMALYGAMKLIAAKRVVIMDYNQRRSLLTSLIEWLEHGDYFRFIQSVEAEMRESFPSVRIIQTGKRAAWYICECEQKP